MILENWFFKLIFNEFQGRIDRTATQAFAAARQPPRRAAESGGNAQHQVKDTSKSLRAIPSLRAGTTYLSKGKSKVKGTATTTAPLI